MEIKLWLIRHGRTAGNALGRYVGRTDEGLSAEGRKQLEKMQKGAAGGTGKTDIYEQSGLSGMHHVKYVFVSPMKRCRETAAILFPEAEQYAVEGLQECDFGDFEYKNYEELNGNAAYQAWIDSGGLIGFPNGESHEQFCGRVQAAFESVVWQMAQTAKNQSEGMALVAHGGTLMAILDAFAEPHRDYFEWQVKNGCGYQVCLNTEEWSAGKKVMRVLDTV